MPSIQNILVASFVAVAAVSAQAQITDGQVQVASALPVSTVVPAVVQATDGQPQVKSAVPVSSAAPVQQATDGQPQVKSAVPTSSAAPVKQIPDGQIQQPVTAASSGVAPAPSANGTFASTKPSATAFTGAAGVMSWSVEMAVAAVGAAAAFAML